VPGVLSASVTAWAEVYVPAAGETVGAAAVGCVAEMVYYAALLTALLV
jgi:hypothetical protein